MNMQRLLICCCLLAATVRGMEASAKDDRNHEMVHVREDNDQAYHHNLHPSAVDMRIVGGWQTTNSRLGGFIVSLWYKNGFTCGGSLIRENIVLSAAHCFHERPNKDNWHVEGGSDRVDRRGVARNVKYFVRHPKFNQTFPFNWDVSVILLDEPMVGTNIHSISLCTIKLKRGMRVDVSGYGYTSEHNPDPFGPLRTMRVPIIDYDRCKQIYSNTLTDTMLCAGVLGRKDACDFDSGGPLVYNKQVCGIISFGVECGSKRYPSVYTDVYAIKSYIEQTIVAMMKMR